MNSGNQRAVVLVSGGLDSAVTLAMARADVGAQRVWGLSFDYGQRHRVELDAARRVCAAMGIAEDRHVVVGVDLRAVGGSALTADVDVPKGRVFDDAIPVTYVPARNLVFLSIGAGLCEVVGAGRIYIGANAVDYSGYPDCREGFLRAFERAAREGTKAGAEGGGLEVVSPLVEMRKAEIIREGARLGVDFSLTHSCYDPVVRGGVVRACGGCDSCVIRARGFVEAGVDDPTVYAPG